MTVSQIYIHSKSTSDMFLHVLFISVKFKMLLMYSSMLTSVGVGSESEPLGAE